MITFCVLLACAAAAPPVPLPEAPVSRPSGPPKVPTAEQLASGGIGPSPGDPLLRDFDTVCRTSALAELEAAAPDAFPWAPGQGESVRVEAMLANQAMLEAAP